MIGAEKPVDVAREVNEELVNSKKVLGGRLRKRLLGPPLLSW
jgi:hypothetical protein